MFAFNCPGIHNCMHIRNIPQIVEGERKIHCLYLQLNILLTVEKLPKNVVVALQFTSCTSCPNIRIISFMFNNFERKNDNSEKEY